MKLGECWVPEISYDECLTVLKTIYDTRQRSPTMAKDVAIMLGYRYGSEAHFYRKIKALQLYGLIENQGGHRVTDLGEKILNLKNAVEKNAALKKSILNIPLWNDILETYGKNPRKDNFWANLMNMTKATSDQCKKISDRIYVKYITDMNRFSNDEKEITETLEDEEGAQTSENIEEIKKRALSNERPVVDLTKGEKGILVIPDIGDTIILDEDTIELAIHSLNILKKRLNEKHKTNLLDSKGQE